MRNAGVCILRDREYDFFSDNETSRDRVARLSLKSTHEIHKITEAFKAHGYKRMYIYGQNDSRRKRKYF